MGGGLEEVSFFYYESKLKYFLGRGGGARVSDFFLLRIQIENKKWVVTRGVGDGMEGSSK